METAYQISLRKIAHQNIDGEVIVIHFDTGCYYSLSGAAAELWQMLDRPRDAGGLRARFAGEAPHAERFVREFIRTLAGEGLIEATSAGAVPATEAIIPVDELVIEKYSDMNAILLADPIHDVEDQGWPKLKGKEGSG